MTPLGDALTVRWIAEDFSVDDRQLIVTSWQSNATIPAYIIDIANFEAPSAPQKIVLPGATESDDQITLKWLSFSKNPDTPNLVYMITNAYGDFSSVVAYDASTKTVIHITTPEPRLHASRPILWDTAALHVTKEVLYFRANVNGWDVLHCIPLIGPHAHNVFEVEFADWEGGSISFRPNDINNKPYELALGLRSHRNSGYIARANLSVLSGTSNLAVEQQQLEDRKIRTSFAVYSQATASAPTYPTNAPQLLTFKSFDELEIPAMYYRPIDRQGPVPLIINIHGGPTSQANAAYRTCV